MRANPVKPKELPRPIVVFNMALTRNRTIQSVSGAQLFLASVLREKFGDNVYMFPEPYPLDFENANPLPFGPLLAGRPLFFAVTLYDILFEATQRRVAKIREVYPQANILIGGPSVNVAKDLKALASFFPQATALVKGDGELVIGKLIEELSAEKPDYQALAGLKGVYIKHGPFEHQNNETNIIGNEEFNSIPTIVPPRSIREFLAEDVRVGKRFYLNTSRGCKKHCRFCSHQYHPVPIRWSAERIIQELIAIKQSVEAGKLPDDARNVAFDDDDFFLDRRIAVEFLERVKKDDALSKFFAFTFQGTVSSFFRKREIDRELLDLLKKLKINVVAIGCDGFHPKALKYFRKGHTLSAAFALMENLYQRKIHYTQYVILTYPAISRRVLVESISNILKAVFVYKAWLNVNFYLQAYEGTPLQAAAQDRMRYLESGSGAKKYLPVELHLEDAVLQQDLANLLKVKLFKGPLAEALKRQDGPGAALWNEIFVKYEKEVGEDVTIGDIAKNSLTIGMSKAGWLFLQSGLQQLASRPSQEITPELCQKIIEEIAS